jgi:hypothetical protein
MSYFDLEVAMKTVWAFGVGERVRLLRNLPGVRAEEEGVVRGASANGDGIRYAIRFDNGMRVVAEQDIGAIAASRQ